MRHPVRLPYAVASLALLFALVATAPSVLAQRAPAGPSASFAALSDDLAFVENRGQWPDDVLFRAGLGGSVVWVTPDALVFDFHAAEAGAQASPERVRSRR